MNTNKIINIDALSSIIDFLSEEQSKEDVWNTYNALILLLMRCERELKGNKTNKYFAPSCSINEIANYLCEHGVKIESEVKNERS